MWPFIKLLPDKTNFKYVAFAPLLMFLSLLACIASLYLTVWPLTPPCGGLNCGVDFKGGSLIEFSTDPRPLDIGLIRAPLNDLGIGEVQVQGFADGTSAMVRYETPEGADADATLARVQETIRQQLGQDVEFGRREVVGPKVSGELFLLGVVALLAGIGADAGLYLVPLRLHLRRRRSDRAGARRDAHVRAVRDYADGVHARRGRLDPHHHRLLDQRQDRRARPGARELAQVQAACR